MKEVLRCPTCSQEMLRVFNPGTFVELKGAAAVKGVVVDGVLEGVARGLYKDVIGPSDVVWVSFSSGEIYNTKPEDLEILHGHFHIGSRS